MLLNLVLKVLSDVINPFADVLKVELDDSWSLITVLKVHGKMYITLFLLVLNAHDAVHHMVLKVVLNVLHAVAFSIEGGVLNVLDDMALSVEVGVACS